MSERVSMQELPFELVSHVIQYCKLQDIAALSQVSRRYSHICRPIIFQSVDISMHNRSKVPGTFSNPYPLRVDKWDSYTPSDRLQCNNILANVQKRQEAFLSALIRDPSLAQHVRQLTWTILSLDRCQGTILEVDPIAIDTIAFLDLKSPFSKIWDVFASLTEVRKLDLAWLTQDLATPLIHNIPPTLFSAATTVRLSGTMSCALTTSILLTNPQNLLHLDLQNILDGQIPNPDPASQTPPPYPTTADALQDLSPAAILQYFYDANHHGPSSGPGPKQLLLRALLEKCTSLRTLRLGKPICDELEYDFPNGHRVRDADFYAEWALFLVSLCPTLTLLVWTQGEQWRLRTEWVIPRDPPTLAAAGEEQPPRLEKVVVRELDKMVDDNEDDDDDDDVSWEEGTKVVMAGRSDELEDTLVETLEFVV